jgi:hypothetical protein
MSVGESFATRASTTASEVAVTFASQLELDWYIIRVHAVGLALWQTFLSFDCTSRDIDICFILGLAMGWFVVASWRRTWVTFLCAACYTAMIVTIIMTEGHIFVSSIPAVDYLTVEGRLQLYFNICILPFATGVFWCVMGSCPGRNIVLDARRAIITFMLISLTFPLYWSRIDMSMVQVFIAGLSHFSIFGILILSPVFKCISIYVMLLSLHKKNTLELVLALAAVLCASSVVMNGVDTMQLVRLCLLAVLLTGHFIILQCSPERVNSLR